MQLLRWLHLGAGLWLSACTGELHGQGTPTNLDPTETSQDPPITLPNGQVAAAPASLKRLRVVEYQNAVRDLLGDGIQIPTDLEEDLARGGFSTISAAIDPYSSTGIEKFEAAASDLAGQVFESAELSSALIGCHPPTANDPCVATFIQRFGRRAFRRALDEAEVQRWSSVVASVAQVFDGDVQKGLEYALAGLLQSPHFLYRTDIGEALPAAPDQRRYTGYEMAARLSFTLWATTPDDALLTAAESGELSTPEGVQAQVARLLASERSKPSMVRFFRELLKVDDLTTELHPKNAALYPNASDALFAAMRQETELSVSDLLGGHKSPLDLLTSPSTFVDDALATFYGITKPAGAGFMQVTLPPGRVGFLTSGTFLAITSHAESTSPTRRGVYLLQSVLCRSVPPPPPNVDITFPADDGTLTTRQRLEQHRQNPTCAACHALFDPLGVAFEHFDALGAFREQENGKAIDATGTLDGVPYDGPTGLAQLLRSSDEVSRCLVSHAYRYNTGHNVVSEADGEGAVIDALTSSFNGAGQDYAALLGSVVTSDAFRHAIGQY